MEMRKTHLHGSVSRELADRVYRHNGNAKAGEKSKQSLDTIVTQGETKTISVVRVAAVSPEKSKHTKPGCPIPQLSFGMLIK